MDRIFSERIKELRSDKNMNQAEFSKLISTNQSTLSAYERGERVPPYETLICIAQLCNVSLDWLCGLSDKKSLSQQIETYSDLIQIIMELKEMDDAKIKISLQEFSKSMLELPTTKLVCDFSDSNLVDFYNEWEDIQAACKRTPSGEKLYNIWLKDALERYDFPLNKEK